MNEETIYNPYNEQNKEITFQGVKKILNMFNVYYDIKNIELFQRAFVHKSHVMPKKLNDDVTLSIHPPNCLELKSSSNERLEFLGDGILENITKFYLYKSPKKISKETEYLKFNSLDVLKKNYKNKFNLNLYLGKDKITLYKN